MDQIKTPFEPIYQIQDHLNNALHYYNDPNFSAESAIHQIRRSFKKVRSLLKLYESTVDEKLLNKLELLIASAARLYTVSRESIVNYNTFLSHADELNKKINTETVELLLQNLKDFKKDHYRASVLERLNSQVKKQIEKFTQLAEANMLPVLTKNSLYSELKHSFRSARDMFKDVLKEPETEIVHDWRKLVKTLHFQASYLNACGFHENTVMLEWLRETGSHLGKDHDMAIMTEFLSNKSYFKELPENKKINKYFKKEIDLKRKQAIDIGETIFTLKTKRFLELMNAEKE